MKHYFFLATIFLLVCASCATAPVERSDAGPLPPGVASLVVRDARIYTGGDDARFVAAMAMRGDEIVYVGDEAGVATHIGERTEVLDLGGRLVLPGFHDVHQHTLEAHLDVIDCIVDPRARDAEDYLRPISRCRPDPDTGWVLGWGYGVLTLLDAERAPRDILDDAHRDTPVAIMEETSHSTWVNSAALDALGIDAETPDPTGGIIVRDAGGRATGLLIDAAGEYPWDAALARTAALDARNRDAIRAGMEDNARFGITSAVDARTYLGRGYLDAYRAAEEAEELTTRMMLSLWASPVAEDDAQIAALGEAFSDEGGFLRARQIKFYSDGLLQNTTAALLAPYLGETLGPSTGLSYFPEARLVRYLRALQPLGFDAHIHAIGDRAVRESLSAIEATQADAGGADARHRLTHVELTHPNDVARFAALGVAADMQLGVHTEPSHLHETADFIGDARVAERAWVLRDLWDAEVVVALSSDFDVGELNPFPAIVRALDRGEQSLPDVAAAIRALTWNGALIMHSERRTGSLEVGKLADFIVIDRDLFEVPMAEIAGARVLLTVVGGEEVYRRGGL